MTADRAHLPDVEELRRVARARLEDATSTGSATVLSAPAMAALLRLAVNPEQVEQAVVLEQELRIHQIEIELLRESLQASEPLPPGRPRD